jgi:SAM-dependent methyltransferase
MVSRSRGYVDYDRVAARYQAGRALSTEVLGRWATAVRPFLPPGRLRIVDVGAGTGIFSAAWPSWTSATVVAVEPSAAMAGAARRAGAMDDRGVWFVRSVAESLPLRSGGADVAWVSTALHHFADVHRAVAELARVLRPGGRVLVRTYVLGRTEIGWLTAFPGRDKWEARCHTTEELRAIFAPHGLELSEIRDVFEWTESNAEAADWVEQMRDADSLLTALTDDEIAAGVSALRSAPSAISRAELTLLVFTLRGGSRGPLIEHRARARR